MQAVTITIRPRRMEETLGWVDALMPFIDEAVVICPADMMAGFSFHGRLRVTTVDENVVLGDLRERFHASTDHQMKNLLLRWAIATSFLIDDQFIMLDDDCRPLDTIDLTELIDNDRHHGYASYELQRWSPNATDFDRGQHATRELLLERGLTTLSFASHMPQAIHKKVMAEAIESVDDLITQGVALDEWSLYFNWGRDRYPELFHPPSPFVTLCWPALPTDWAYDQAPTTFRFENFYPELYRPGRLFADLPTHYDPNRWQRHTKTKIERRCAVQRQFDSAPARLDRRFGWLVHRLASRFSRVSRILPRTMRQRWQRAAEHGHDPAYWRSYNRLPPK